MKQENIKKSIKKKFGTLSKFCKLSGYDRMKLQILLAVRHPELMELSHVSDLCRKTKLKALEGDITPKIVNALKSKLEVFGGVRLFCSKYPEFAEPSVYQILDGNRVRLSKKVKKLCKVLEVKI